MALVLCWCIVIAHWNYSWFNIRDINSFSTFGNGIFDNICSLIGYNCKVLARYYDNINGCFHFPCHVSRAPRSHEISDSGVGSVGKHYIIGAGAGEWRSSDHGDEGCRRRIDILSSWLRDAQVRMGYYQLLYNQVLWIRGYWNYTFCGDIFMLQSKSMCQKNQ